VCIIIQPHAIATSSWVAATLLPAGDCLSAVAAAAAPAVNPICSAVCLHQICSAWAFSRWQQHSNLVLLLELLLLLLLTMLMLQLLEAT
jgi:hypothetical protein